MVAVPLYTTADPAACEATRAEVVLPESATLGSCSGGGGGPENGLQGCGKREGTRACIPAFRLAQDRPDLAHN